MTGPGAGQAGAGRRLRLAVLGASGFLGGHVRRSACDAGLDVVTAGRTPLPDSGAHCLVDLSAQDPSRLASDPDRAGPRRRGELRRGHLRAPRRRWPRPTSPGPTTLVRAMLMARPVDPPGAPGLGRRVRPERAGHRRSPRPRRPARPAPTARPSWPATQLGRARPGHRAGRRRAARLQPGRPRRARGHPGRPGGRRLPRRDGQRQRRQPRPAGRGQGLRRRAGRRRRGHRRRAGPGRCPPRPCPRPSSTSAAAPASPPVPWSGRWRRSAATPGRCARTPTARRARRRCPGSRPTSAGPGGCLGWRPRRDLTTSMADLWEDCRDPAPR